MTVSALITRNDITATASQTSFAYTFRVLVATDMDVYQNGALLSSGYTVNNVGTTTGGTVVLDTGVPVGQIVSLVLAMPLIRTTDYQNSGTFLASAVNADVDKAYIGAIQNENESSRSLKLKDVEPTIDMTLPLKADRKGKYLTFNAATGAPEAVEGSSASVTDASLVNYTAGGTDAVATTVQAKLRESVSVKDFGAVGDGFVNDAPAIQAALDSGVGLITFPKGTFRISESLLLDNETSIEGVGGSTVGTSINPDVSVLEAVKVGSVSLWVGTIRNCAIIRPAYSSATENVGWALYDLANSLFDTVTSRFSKYNWYIKPQDNQRVAYSTFLNCGATGGLYNVTGSLAGSSGYSNELLWIGGRFFTSADTDTNMYLNWSCNHLRLIGVSLEGAGTQSVYINGISGNAHSNLIQNCRFEGTWSTAAIVLGASTLNNTVSQFDLFTTVSDLGLNNNLLTKNGSVIKTGVNGSKPLSLFRSGSTNDAPMLDLTDSYTPSGNSYGLRYTAARPSGYFARLLYNTAELFAVSILNSAQSLLKNTGRALFARNTSLRTEPLFTIKEEFSNSGNDNLIQMRVGRGIGNGLSIIKDNTDAKLGGINLLGALSAQFEASSPSFTRPPILLGSYNLWVDSSGKLRIKSGAPTSDTDGTVVGTQT